MGNSRDRIWGIPTIVDRAGAADGRGLESLTGRELEIGCLIVDRKTNREIAAEQFLGQKTVEGPGDATAGDIRVFGHDAIHDYAEARLAVGLAPRATQTLNVELVMRYWSSAAGLRNRHKPGEKQDLA